jgi:3-phenylpropionate/cinnamic acid dioxygenase small subunit
VTTTDHPTGSAPEPVGASAERVAAMVRHHEVEQFLYDEAAILDRHDYDAWLELFADDAHYFMPIRRTRMAHDADREFTTADEMAWFNDTKLQLAGRVTKLHTGRSWAEDPPSRTRHLVTNVRVVDDDGTEIAVESNFHLYRTRLKSEEDSWIGSRRDVLRRTDTGLQIARRTILIEQTVLLSRNLSTFF